MNPTKFLLAAIAVTSMVSCTKKKDDKIVDYTCICYWKYGLGTPDTAYPFHYKADTGLAAAQAACAGKVAWAKDQSDVHIGNCELR